MTHKLYEVGEYVDLTFLNVAPKSGAGFSAQFDDDADFEIGTKIVFLKTQLT